MHPLPELARRPSGRLLPAGPEHRETGEPGAVPPQRAGVPAFRKKTMNPIDIAQVEYWLEEWRYMMDSAREVEGYPGNSSVWQFAKRAVNEDYSGILQDQSNSAAAAAIDAKIDSLLPHQSAAIYRAYDQAHVWTWKRLDYLTVLAEAKQRIGEMMRADGWPC